MDRQAVIGFVLIFVVLMAWLWMSAPKPQPVEASKAHPADTVQHAAVQKAPPPPKPTVRDTTGPPDYGKFFEARSKGSERILVVETERYIAKITSKGARVKEWILKGYKTWNGYPVELVDYKSGGDFSLLFGTSDGKLVNTSDLYFDASFRNWQEVKLEGEEEYRVALTLPSSNGGEIVKTFVFRNGTYDFQTSFRFVNMNSVIANYEYQVVWEHGVRYAERNSVDESRFAGAYAYAGGELSEIDASKVGEVVTKDLGGVVDWVATKSKYFCVAIMSVGGASEGAYLEGDRVAVRDNGDKETYSVALKVPYRGLQDETDSVRVFLGPMDYNVLKSYDKDFEDMMSLGWSWIRPISIYVVLPLFKLIHDLVPNWGLVLIIFAIIVKVVLHPLTKSSMKSMRKMQSLQPMIEELRAKYKEDPQKLNQQMVGLYKEYGVNPAGGCLPLLLQFPILIALYNVFMSAIELRQSAFIWWMTDLSVPDHILTLPFALPIFGVREVSGLALLMGVTTFVQQKMSVKDPRQKAMVWIMPVFLTLLFNSFPAGLNLYYFCFNILSIGQQFYINKQHEGEPLRKVEKKKGSRGGIFGKYTKDLPRFKK